MRKRARKIGILGGTFNPVHLGHLALARAARQRFRLDEVWFIPCARPPHKTVPDLASDRDRMAMLRAALRDEPSFKVRDIELRRKGVSYSIKTVRAFKRRYPHDRFYFIIGADMLSGLHEWRNIHELLGLCRFVTMQRPGARQRSRAIRLGSPWRAKLKAGFFRGPLLNISSSDIRERARRGLSIRDLVPEAVARYIEQKAVYAGKGKRPSKQ